MADRNRLLAERALDPPARTLGRLRAARSVTVNLAESPLGWLLARGHLTRRQFDAGERLRRDYERSALAARVTMRWDAAPVARARGGAARRDPSLAQLDARRRFDGAVAAAGSGLSDILWRVVCAGEGMRAAESALGWPARAGKLVLTIALDRLAEHYRLPRS
ncbi:DUF6456 domain-containing protein [Sphingomonas mesophila]|uniref:DUF6456 domain-containing protein n=1 Tax=Sphingomonas mesophila TaxID=2303576 RepID=UPI001F078A5A|nr:DUF6456 domain-containing protein [Sphingomonas mesophila]